ncbi:L-asparagine permease [Salmonella enterica subsp. enterica]|uniref:L-asparagine permease n=1 Tax=Salmonella enterica I TaxID=59201 RepID=A0A3S4J1F9_SALET|nr:L-asparagine permease [Salmonella enterica subsp. enterica]
MKTQTTHAAEQHAAKRRWLNAHEEGYHKAMGNRQVQMIAIGGAIGTGLFLGAGARLQMAGPALALVYLICGIFSFFILRALGELVLHRPSSGVSSPTPVNFWVKKRPTSQAGCTLLTGR